MKIKRLLEIDFAILLSVISLIVIGILFIYSSGISSDGTLVSNEYIKQIFWAGTGIVFTLFISIIDYRRLYNISIYLYLILLIIVLYTLFMGRSVSNTRAWVGFGGFGIQPSEFLKIFTILVLAKHLEQTRHDNSFKRMSIALIIVFIPVGLILLQPDLGTALVYVPMFIAMCYIADIRKQYLWFFIVNLIFISVFTVFPYWNEHFIKNKYAILNILFNNKTLLYISIFSAIIFLIAMFGFKKYSKRYFYFLSFFSSSLSVSLLFSMAARKILKEYQIMRLIVFIDPNIDPKGSGWHIIQSMTAIGSGGAIGKGFLKGTQSHYRFLPEQSTDFIFSILSEEMGFIGGLIIFSLFFVILMRSLNLVKITDDYYGKYIVIGISAVIFFHFLINVGMTIGIMPITGIPLIFLSYGGSSLWSSLIGIGLILSVYVRRYDR